MPDFGPCVCRERKEANERGEFREWPDREGWIFADGPFRTRTTAAQYFASERGVDDHTGEPFVHTVCPWCGCDLPLTKPEWCP